MATALAVHFKVFVSSNSTQGHPNMRRYLLYRLRIGQALAQSLFRFPFLSCLSKREALATQAPKTRIARGR